MPLGTIDRRVTRTRTMLHNALLSSLRAKSYDAITVEDLCAKAKIGRSTFYAHYTGKDDLLRARLAHLRDALIERRRTAAKEHPARAGLLFSRIMFEHAYEHVQLHRHLLGNRGGSITFAMIRDMLAELVREEIAPAGRAARGDALIEDFTTAYIVGAFMSVMDWWMKQGMALPPQQIDALFQRSVAEGVTATSQP